MTKIKFNIWKPNQFNRQRHKEIDAHNKAAKSWVALCNGLDLNDGWEVVLIFRQYHSV